MKTTTRLLMFLLVLCLCGCRTKEKVTEHLTETALSSSTSVQVSSVHTEQAVQEGVQEEATHTQQSDSTVERFYERIVTDSTGRVLLHEVEHSKDTYKGSGRQQTKRTDNHQEKTTTQLQELAAAKNDSIYNGGNLREVTVVKPKSWKWLWIAGVLSLLLTVGTIIIRRK